jgi:hypothetical protein
MTARFPIRTRAVWKAADAANADDWRIDLTDAERDEIVLAAKEAVRIGRTLATVRRADFDIAALRPKIGTWVEMLGRGRGFVLLRRFPIEEMTADEIELAYVGLGLQLGTPVGQDAQGSILGHVRDEGIPRTDPGVRFYRTNARQDFHTDGSDIVGLLCLERAKRGGESRIASAGAVYNEILRQRPDLLEVFYRPMYWDRNDEQGPGEDPYFALPPLNDVNGSPRLFYIGWYIRDAQRHDEVPRLAADQIEAMELIEAIANDPAYYVEMDFQPGDIQLLSNAKILHSREAYEDDARANRRRHLLRLWLTAYDFASVDDVLRQGIPPSRRPE